MRVTGIIAEYNPFHNGHLYQLETAKKETDADFIIIVLSGDFMQRGIPGILNKWERATMALACGADLVLELPVLSACASAEAFAAGGVSLLQKTGVVTNLCFGAETADSEAFLSLAGLLNQEPDEYKKLLRKELKLGKSFPAARNAAIRQYLGTDNFSELLSSPNNILGLEYTRSLLKNPSSIKPYIVKRKGSGYNDESFSGAFSSATAIRRSFADTEFAGQSHATSCDIWDSIPLAAQPLLKDALENNIFLFLNDFSSMLSYKLLLEKEKGFSSYLDVNEDLSNKIKKELSSFQNWSDFVLQLKSKELTHTRISRALLHILLNITDEKSDFAKEYSYAPYLRVLGFRQSATPLLSAIKKNASVPLVTKLADAKKTLSKDAFFLLQQDIFAADVYRLAQTAKTGKSFPDEFKHSPILF